MPLFKDEQSMQKWIEKSLAQTNDFANLISNIATYQKGASSSGTQPLQKYESSYAEVCAALYCNSVISQNENISLKNGDVLKPDFVLYTAENEGIVIIELKNFQAATRELGTEILAYTGEIKTHIPFLPDLDMYYVIVSPEWPTLLKHFIFHEIYWQEKNLLCLAPVSIDDVPKLMIVPPETLLDFDAPFRIANENLTGYQLCLYDPELYNQQHDRRRLDKHVTQMQTALHVMATEGTKHRAHGFAFLWKDNLPQSLAPYSMTVINMSPFSSIERFLHGDVEPKNLSKFQKTIIRLMSEEAPSGHGRSLERIKKVAEIFLESFCDPMPEAFTTWPALKDIMLPRATMLGFRGWGLFEQHFNAKLMEAYARGEFDQSEISPEIGMAVVDEIIDPTYPFIDLCGLDPFGDNDNVNGEDIWGPEWE